MRTGRSTGTVGALLLAATLTLGTPLAPPAAADPGEGLDAREWNQPRGNGMRTGIVKVKPVASTPVDAWTLQFEKVNGAPVTWGGTLFVAADGDLIALDPITGEERGRKALRLKEDVELASWQGTVVVREEKRLRSFDWLGDKFKNGWTRRGDWDFGLVVNDGMLLAPDLEGGVHALLIDKGKQCKDPGDGFGTPTAETVDGETIAHLAKVGLRGEEKKARLHVARSKVGLDRMKQPEFQVERRSWLREVLGKEGQRTELTRSSLPDGSDVIMHALTFRPDKGPSGWFIADSNPTLSKACRIVSRPLAYKGMFFGFSERGDLMYTDEKGETRPFVRKADLPSGVTPRPGSGADNVLIFGNWAVDFENRRVLWSRTDVQPRGSAFPAADGLLVIVGEDETLRGLADPTIVDLAALSGDGADTAPARREITLPDDRDGVLLADGRFVPGELSTMTGDFEVKPVDGEKFTVDEEDILVAQKGGDVQFDGSEFEVYELWREGIQNRHIDALVEIFEGCLEAGLVDESSGYLQEAREYGLPHADAEELLAKLTGKRQHPNAKVRAKKWLEKEGTARDERHAEALRGATWCHERGFSTAATVLLTLADRLKPGEAEKEIEKRAQEYVPDEFPWKSEPRSFRKWRVWAGEILPADAKFCGSDDSAWSRARNEPWQLEKTILLRSRNLLFFSRTDDPQVVGACLRNGEGAVKTLRVLLKVGPEDKVTSDKRRMDVRLHTDRESYLNEVLPGGGKPIEWSAGFYTPSENVSRFYVPELGDENVSGRSLYKTLVHELTHHFVEMRYMPLFGANFRSGALQAGHWIVEGFARFVEDQTIEVSRRGVRFDDPTVTSVDVVVQLAAQKKLMNVADMVNTDYTGFHALPKDMITRVKLANTFEAYGVDHRKRYYDQSGTLVYFMVNERGEEGRDRLISYLKKRYQGRIGKDNWTELGFDSGEEFHAAFEKWLLTLAKK